METKLRKKSLIYFWSWVVVAKVAPFLILGYKFGLFSPTTSQTVKWSFTAIFIILWGVFSLFSSIVEFVDTMKEGLWREIIHAVAELFLPALMWVSALIARAFIEDYLFFTGTIFVATAIGVVLRALHQKNKRALLKERGYVNVLK